jgi:hypothetical protein
MLQCNTRFFATDMMRAQPNLIKTICALSMETVNV